MYNTEGEIKYKDIDTYGSPIFEYYKDMKIFIPEKSNVDFTTTSIDVKKMKTYLSKFIFLDNFFTFIIFHLGVLERSFNNDEVAILKFINGYKDNECIPILTSGRGIPNIVKSHNLRFVNYSSISRYLIEDVSKFHLTKMLFSVRNF
jgi:hypothetical protein